MRMRFPRFLFAKSGIVIIFSFVPVMTVRTRARGVKPEIPEFFDLSFEELSNIQVHVPAVLTKLSPEEIPASITVIIAGDIRRPLAIVTTS